MARVTTTTNPDTTAGPNDEDPTPPFATGEDKLVARIDAYAAKIAALEARLEEIEALRQAAQSAAEARADRNETADEHARRLPAASFDPEFIAKAAASVGVTPEEVFDIKILGGTLRVVTVDARKLDARPQA